MKSTKTSNFNSESNEKTINNLFPSSVISEKNARFFEIHETVRQKWLDHVSKKLSVHYADDPIKSDREYKKRLQKCIYQVCLAPSPSKSLFNRISVIFKNKINLFQIKATKKSVIWYQTESNQTVFHAAAIADDETVVKKLLSQVKKVIKSKDVITLLNQIDTKGKTALDYTKKESSVYVLLSNEGATESAQMAADSLSSGQKRKTKDKANEILVTERPAKKIKKNSQATSSSSSSLNLSQLFRKPKLYRYEQNDDYYSSDESEEDNCNPPLKSFIDSNTQTQFVVLYRGITFLQKNYDTNKKKALKGMNLTQNDLLSYGAKDLTNREYTACDSVKAIKMRFTKMSVSTKNELIELYVKDSAKYQEKQASEMGGNSTLFHDAMTPKCELISFDLSASTACGYAMELTSGSRIKRNNKQYVHYDKKGKPHHRYAGIVIAVAQPVTEWDESTMIYVKRLWAQNRIAIDFFKSKGNEVIAVGGVANKNIILQQPILLPDLSKPYKNSYRDLYGYTEKQFTDIACRFLKYANDSSSLRRQSLEMKILVHIREHTSRVIKKKLSHILVGEKVYPSIYNNEFTRNKVKHDEAHAFRKPSSEEKQINSKNSSSNPLNYPIKDTSLTGLNSTKQAIDCNQKDGSDLAKSLLVKPKNLSNSFINYQYTLFQEQALIEKEKPNKNTLIQPGYKVFDTSENIKHFISEVISLEKTINIYSENKIDNKAMSAIKHFLNNQKDLQTSKKIFQNTDPSQAVEISNYIKKTDLMLIYYCRSLCHCYFNKDSAKYNLATFRRFLEPCQELIFALDYYVQFKADAHQWLSFGVNSHAMTPETLPWLHQARINLESFLDSSERNTELQACVILPWTFLHNMIAALEDDMNEIKNLSRNEINVCTELFCNLKSLLMKVYVSGDEELEEASEWNNKLEDFANAILDFIENSSANGSSALEWECMIRTWIINMYETHLHDLMSSEDSTDTINQLKKVIFSQYKKIAQLKMCIGNAGEKNRYHAFLNQLHCDDTVNKPLTTEAESLPPPYTPRSPS